MRSRNSRSVPSATAGRKRAPTETVEDLDLTEEDPIPGTSPEVFDKVLEERRETTRGEIAGLLVRLLVGLAASAVLLVAFSSLLRIEIADIKEVMSTVFPSTVALVGTVLGFYFGEKARPRR